MPHRTFQIGFDPFHFYWVQGLIQHHCKVSKSWPQSEQTCSNSTDYGKQQKKLPQTDIQKCSCNNKQYFEYYVKVLACIELKVKHQKLKIKLKEFFWGVIVKQTLD